MPERVKDTLAPAPPATEAPRAAAPTHASQAAADASPPRAEMTRSVDLRSVPPLLWIDRAGQMAALALRCATELVTPGLSWRREAIVQCANVFWLAIVPVLLINFLVGFAGAGVSGGAALEAFGAVDR